MVPLTSKRRQVQEGWWMAKQINLSVPIFHQISWHSILTYLNKRRWEQSNRHPPSQGRKAFCKRIKIYTRSKTKKAEPCSFINTTISTMALQPNGTSTHYGRLLYAVTGYSIIFPHTHTQTQSSKDVLNVCALICSGMRSKPHEPTICSD